MIIHPPTHIPSWLSQHKSDLQPPISNKLLFRGQSLSIMFVGGPNSRTDFHSEEGSEVFYQLEGMLEVVTMQQGKRTPVMVKPGDMYCLPSRVPHSPQRKTPGAGLVVERIREPGEYDRMSWYDNFETCNRVTWERYFVCTDLGKDLKPVADEYVAIKNASADAGIRLNPPSLQPCLPHIPFPGLVPAPVQIRDVVNYAQRQHTNVHVFGSNHPDQEFDVVVETSPQSRWIRKDACREMFIYQLQGKSKIWNAENDSQSSSAVVLHEQVCVVVSSPLSSTAWMIDREDGNSETLVIRVRDVLGNKKLLSTSKLHML